MLLTLLGIWHRMTKMGAKCGGISTAIIPILLVFIVTVAAQSDLISSIHSRFGSWTSPTSRTLTRSQSNIQQRRPWQQGGLSDGFHGRRVADPITNFPRVRALTGQQRAQPIFSGRTAPGFQNDRTWQNIGQRTSLQHFPQRRVVFSRSRDTAGRHTRQTPISARGRPNGQFVGRRTNIPSRWTSTSSRSSQNLPRQVQPQRFNARRQLVQQQTRRVSPSNVSNVPTVAQPLPVVKVKSNQREVANPTSQLMQRQSHVDQISNNPSSLTRVHHTDIPTVQTIVPDFQTVEQKSKHVAQSIAPVVLSGSNPMAGKLMTQSNLHDITSGSIHTHVDEASVQRVPASHLPKISGTISDPWTSHGSLMTPINANTHDVQAPVHFDMTVPAVSLPPQLPPNDPSLIQTKSIDIPPPAAPEPVSLLKTVETYPAVPAAYPTVDTGLFQPLPTAPANIPPAQSTTSLHDELVAALVAAFQGQLSHAPVPLHTHAPQQVAAHIPAATNPLHTQASQFAFGSRGFMPQSHVGHFQPMYPAHMYPAYMQEMMFGDTQDPPDPTAAPEVTTPVSDVTIPVTIVAEPVIDPISVKSPKTIPAKLTKNSSPSIKVEPLTSETLPFPTTPQTTDILNLEPPLVSTEIPIVKEKVILKVEPIPEMLASKISAKSASVKGKVKSSTRKKLLAGIKGIISSSKVDLRSLTKALADQLSALKSKKSLPLKSAKTVPVTLATTLQTPKVETSAFIKPSEVKADPVPALKQKSVKIRSLVDPIVSTGSSTLRSILQTIASQSEDKGVSLLPSELHHAKFTEIASLLPKGTDLAKQLSDPNFVNLLREILSKLTYVAHAPELPEVTTHTTILSSTEEYEAEDFV